MKFKEEYWKQNYCDLDEMDGVANAKEHAQYVKSLFDLQGIPVNSIVDLGFGLGYLLKSFEKKFRPIELSGVEPSKEAYLRVSKSKWMTGRVNCTLHNETLQKWCQRKQSVKFDLGICNSVFQYLPDKDLETVSKRLSKVCRFLYFSVPTQNEYSRQLNDHDFVDSFAFQRSYEDYMLHLFKDWTFVGFRLLESKKFFRYETSSFCDELFRFP